MSCQQVPTAPAFNPYPRSVQVGEFDVATDGGIWVAIGVPMRLVEQTIERLGLDDPACRELRARWYQEYLEHGLPSAYLRSKSPFVWTEAERQGLL